MLTILTGKSTSGKDSIAHELENLGYKHIPSFTSRKMRTGEMDGNTYHFIDTKTFLTKIQNDEFLEWRWYNKSDENIVFYGSDLQDVMNASDKSYMIITPSGIKKLKEKGIECKVFYISVSDDEIKRRQKLRGDATKEEMERRFQADKRDFEDIEELADYTIINEKCTALDSAFKINAILKGLI